MAFPAALPGLATVPPPAAPRPHRLDATAAFTLPFDLVGELIVLRNLTLNGQPGDFILDTGNATALVVDNAAYAGHLAATQRAGYGATGTMAVQALPVTNFQLGPARYTGFAADAIPLAHVRRYAGDRVRGLIGYGLLRDYEVVIDYPHRRVSWYTLRTSTPARRPFARRDSLAFALVRGVPVADGAVGQVLGHWLLDTGAATNQLDARFCRTLAPADRPTAQGTAPLTGSDGHPQVAQVGILPEVVLAGTAWRQMPVQVLAFARPASGRPLAYQGTLGFPFLSQDHVISFHYGRQQFYTLTPVVAPARGGRR